MATRMHNLWMDPKDGGIDGAIALTQRWIKLNGVPILARSLRACMMRETVFTCAWSFDLLHMGHLRHLEEARSYGDCLVVSITPDRFVNKGPGRPVFEELMRAEMLAAMSSVDWVVINDQPTAEAMIETVRPHSYVKGPDYVRAEDDVSGKISAEQACVEKFGGKIVFTDDITFSSSELINRHFSPFAPDVRTFIHSMRDADQKQPLLIYSIAPKVCACWWLGKP